MKQTNCRSCGTNMEGRWFSICPHCGRYMATRTVGEVVTIYAVSGVVGLIVVIAMVVLLWQFA